MGVPDVLVQIHIPKCAGTSVGVWLREASISGNLAGFGSFYSNFVFDDDGLWEAGLRDPRLTAISAHNIRRFVPEIHGRRMHYFTILRQPLAHFISMVRYMIQERRAYGIPPEVGDTSREIATWILERPVGSHFRNNAQTDHLALYPWCDATEGRCDPLRYASWDLADQVTYERERLDVAKRALVSFLAVGTVERLHDTLEVLRRRSAVHGLHLLPAGAVQLANVTRTPIDDVSWLDNTVIGERVVDSLTVDLELYGFAQQLLAQAYEEQPPDSVGAF